MYLIYPNPIMIAFMAMAPVMALFDLRRGPPRRQEVQRRGAQALGRDARQARPATCARSALEEERERNAGAPDAGELDPPRDLAHRRPVGAPAGRPGLPAPAHRHRRSGGAVRGRGRVRRRRRASASARPTSTPSSASIPAAPVMVAIPEAGAVGLGGAPPGVIALSRWLLVQAIALHSPRELSIAVGVRPELVTEFGWLKWAPHVAEPGSPLEGEPLAVGPAETRRLVEEVIALQRRRTRGAGAPRRAAADAAAVPAAGARRAGRARAQPDRRAARRDHALRHRASSGSATRCATCPASAAVTIEHDPHLASIIAHRRPHRRRARATSPSTA